VSRFWRRTSIQARVVYLKNFAHSINFSRTFLPGFSGVSSLLCKIIWPAIVDAASTMVEPIKVISWYDNEFGYSCLMIDLIFFQGRKAVKYVA
jgi:glyceraldehyde-3-phosphate dehydrogenase/erythrose-4-phosphate dehydrogenase